MPNPPTTDLLSDFWQYCQCYQIPRRYALWSAIGLLAASNNRRIFIYQGDIKISCLMYITLIGDQGMRKTTPKDFVFNIFKTVWPDIPIGQDVASREAIIKHLASPEAERQFILNGATVTFRPYMMFIDELANWISFDPRGMVAFMTNIYDRNRFTSDTIKRSIEDIVEPAFNILACCTTTQIIDKLKSTEISGGLCRRMLFVYSPVFIPRTMDEAIAYCRPIPQINPEARDAQNRIISHLNSIKSVSGQFTWHPEAREYFTYWYYKNQMNLPAEPILQGFSQTMDMQLLKVCMNLAMAKPNPQLILTKDLLEVGIALLEDIRNDMPVIFAGSGRNPLAVPTQNLLSLLESKGGLMQEKLFKREMERDFKPDEAFRTFLALIENGQISVKDMEHTTTLLDGSTKSGTRKMVLSRNKYLELGGKPS